MGINVIKAGSSGSEGIRGTKEEPTRKERNFYEKFSFLCIDDPENEFNSFVRACRLLAAKMLKGDEVIIISKDMYTSRSEQKQYTLELLWTHAHDNSWGVNLVEFRDELLSELKDCITEIASADSNITWRPEDIDETV